MEEEEEEEEEEEKEEAADIQRERVFAGKDADD